MENIIETILKSAANKIELTAENFFTDNNPNGYCTKTEFLTLLPQISERNLKKTELIYEYLSEGFDNNNPAVVETDADTGLPRLWTVFKLGGSTQNIPYYVVGNMALFIKDCQKRKIKPRFTFEELYAAAINQNKV